MGASLNRTADRCGIGATPGVDGEDRGVGPLGAPEAGVESEEDGEGEDGHLAKMVTYRINN